MGLLETIQEEVSKVLNEGRIFYDENQDFVFVTQLNNSTFNNYESISSEYDNSVLGSNIIITWKLSFWLAQEGIENFNVDVQGIKGQYQVVSRDKRSDEKMQDTLKDIGEIEWKFIPQDMSLTTNGALYINRLDFDFQTNECKIYF